MNRRLIRRAIESPTRIEENATHRTYLLEVRRKIQGGGIFYDRFKVVTPMDAAPRSLRYRLLSRVIIETEAARLNAKGQRTADIVRFHYSLAGKPSGDIGVRIRRVRSDDGSVRDRTTATYRGAEAWESFWTRWAPHESGKFSWLFLGGLISLPAYALAGAPVHPWEIFAVAGLAGLIGAICGYLMKTYKGKKWVERSVVWAPMLLTGATLNFHGIPAMIVLIVVGFVAAILAQIYTPQKSLKLPVGPASAASRRAGGLLAKIKYAVIGGLALMMLAAAFLPSPVSADLRGQITAKMAATGPVGREYSDYMKSHPESHLYVVKPWHRGAGKLESAYGVQEKKIPFVRPSKISLNGSLYGIGTWGEMELALSTILHEFDHDKQEQDLNGVAVTTSHEHSAWDHQARFIIEQFIANPKLFDSDGTKADIRRLSVLSRAVHWLNLGPADHRALVNQIYDKNPKLGQVRHPNAEVWKAYYAAQRAESEAAWREHIVDVNLVGRINDQHDLLNLLPSARGEAPAMKPDGSTLGGAFFSGLAWLLALLGFERLAGRIKKK